MRFFALAAALALALMQGLAAAHVELTFDEAYYAMWARWPQAGYYDHPPLVAWTIAASQRLFGGGEFGVRALFWLAGASLPALVFWIARRLYDEATGAAAALILIGAPMLAGAPLATPDTPLAFFWTLALTGLVEVWRGRESAWAVVGLAVGAADLAKMTAGFLALGIALALAMTPSLRRQFRRPGPWGAAALALIVVSPFLYWNGTHGFATFVKQGGRLEAHGFAPRYLGEFIGVQVLLFNPLTAAAAIYGLSRRRAAPSEPTRLLLAIAVPALGYFALHALHDRVQGNWPAPLYPALAILAARALRPTIWPAWAAASGLAVVAAAYLHLATAWPNFGPQDPSLRIGGWRELAAQASAQAKARGDNYILAEGYAATALLTFYGSGPPVIEDGEPQRWGFRPPVDTQGPGLVFAREPCRESARPTCATAKTLRRQVGGVELEGYTLSPVGGDAP